MAVTTEYAEIVNSSVIRVIVADAGFIASLPNAASWFLTPYDIQTRTGKVGIGWMFVNGIFTAPFIVTTVAVTAPNPLKLMIRACGSGGVSYQWRKDGQDLQGQTAALLTIDPTTAGTDSGSYRCMLTLGQNYFESDAITVTVS
jgi:hypothetical protein